MIRVCGDYPFLRAMVRCLVTFLLLHGGLAVKIDQYRKVESLMGPDFFNHWSFYTGPDPTHGNVDFVGKDEAWTKKLLSASADRVLMKADNTTLLSGTDGRGAVRIESLNRYNGGLFILTLDHVPTACGAWPAFWMFGDDAQHAWPRWGEFDILESIHMLNYATTTLHTRDNCDQRAVNEGIDFEGQGWAVGTQENKAKNCWVKAPQEYDNQGCGQKLPMGSFGPDFNRRGGGTFVAEWDPVVNKRLRTWFFPAGTEPEFGENPDPDLWGVPNSFFTLNERWCTAAHFKNMRMVFDTTFCGDYAGGSFAAYCGWTQMQCEDYVRTKPEAFSQAFWSIKRLDVYQSAAVSSAGFMSSMFGLGSSSPTSPLGIFMFLLLLGLAAGLIYMSCSPKRLEAIQAAAGISPYATQAARGPSLGTSPKRQREVFLRTEDLPPTRLDFEQAPQGWSFARVMRMMCCTNDPPPDNVHSPNRPVGYDEVAPVSPVNHLNQPRVASRQSSASMQAGVARQASGTLVRQGSGKLVRQPSGALVRQGSGLMVVPAPSP
ncbi:unnamed protein product [Effrenium voratum]|uniref:GH16 domain-containing protein n=1 Tax=Effrenium voratum TaxID=2562239 RepID=A0AA36JCD2_9DINO|nr:unnamed protein product [Effrenium voratum]CAJ1431074.1 unnamed protein product [Effrenium voratum]